MHFARLEKLRSLYDCAAAKHCKQDRCELARLVCVYYPASLYARIRFRVAARPCPTTIAARNVQCTVSGAARTATAPTLAQAAMYRSAPLLRSCCRAGPLLPAQLLPESCPLVLCSCPYRRGALCTGHIPPRALCAGSRRAAPSPTDPSQRPTAAQRTAGCST